MIYLAFAVLSLVVLVFAYAAAEVMRLPAFRPGRSVNASPLKTVPPDLPADLAKQTGYP